MRRYIWGALISCFLCAQAFGITLFPTVIELNTDHRAASQLVVTNNSTQALPLEANVRRLNFLSDGTFETSDLASEEMFVFPPAAMLAPENVKYSVYNGWGTEHSKPLRVILFVSVP